MHFKQIVGCLCALSLVGCVNKQKNVAKNPKFWIFGDIPTFIKSQHSIKMRLIFSKEYLKSLFSKLEYYFVLFEFNPQKFNSDLLLCFHFLGSFFSCSFSSVANALIISVVVISRYFIVVSIFSCPSRN